MKLFRLIFLLFLMAFGSTSTAQDSLSFSTELGLLGRRQTGNLDQLVLSPSARLKIGKSSFDTEITATYQFLEVNGFRSINDLWINNVVRIKPTKRVYSFSIVYYGFADSYRIDRSLIGGAGLGINVVQSTLDKYLQVHLYGGYASVDFQQAPSQSSPSFGSFVKAAFPLNSDKLSLLWEFHSYHALNDQDFEGVNNILQIRYALFKGFHLNASHTTIFNNTVNEGIAKTNTLMMFGLAYSYNKTY